MAAHDQYAGPALMLSFVVAGIACVFAALCYAEFASMVPVAGSAYTYAYATLGELFAWIIGWDLVLEYAVGVVDRGPRLVALLSGLPRTASASHFPHALHVAHRSTSTPADAAVRRDRRVSSTCRRSLIVALITVVLVIGIRESAELQRRHGRPQAGIVLFVIVVGAFYINPANWHPFAPYGYTGISFFGHTCSADG